MATASTQRLENLLECPICLKKVTEPRAFDCHHFYCQPCINDLKPKRDGGAIGYDCPMCRHFTPKDKLKTIHFLHELLEILEIAKKEQQQVCGMCKDSMAELRCIDCKDTFCPSCKEQHNRVPILKNHEWEPLSETKSNVVDKHIYCTQHPKEVVKFNCKECEKLICIICNGTQHKQHTAEAIEEAAERVLSIVRRQNDEVKKIIRRNKETLAKAVSGAEDLEKQYSEVEKQIKDHYEEVIKKAKEDMDQIEGQLQGKKNEQLDGIKEWIKNTETKLKSQEQIVALSGTTLSTAQHASLLQALQTGVRKGLESYVKEKPEKPTYDHKIKAEFTPSKLTKTNLIGSVSSGISDTIITRPLFNNCCLSEIRSLKPKLNKESDIGFLCSRFTKEDDELWCVEHSTDTVHVFDEQLNKGRSITFSNIGKCRSVAKVGSGIMVAASNGLYQTKLDGSNPRMIKAGNMTDACWMGNSGYILDNGKAKVHVVKFDLLTDTVTKEKDISLATYSKDDRNTIQVTPDLIAIAQISAHSILKYTHGGVLISSHGSPGAATGQLNTPWLCGADRNGAILVAEERNHRLQILEPDGTWHSFKVEGLHFCAITDNNTLLVSYNKKLRRYTIK